MSKADFGYLLQYMRPRSANVGKDNLQTERSHIHSTSGAFEAECRHYEEAPG